MAVPQVIGHDSVRTRLEQHLPPVALLRGPASVGKRTLSLHLADHHRVLPVDRMHTDAGLHMDVVRAVLTFVGVAPFGRLKLVTADLDQATEPALHALLKVLEEPPVHTRFLLRVSSRVLPATVTSRCQVYPMGLLPDAQVCEVLLGQGWTPAAATRAAALACGQVARAVAAGSLDRYRDGVVELMKAVATRDLVMFDQALSTVDDDSFDLVYRWLVEAMTRQWRVYGENEMFGLHRNRKLLDAMLRRLLAVPRSPARLGLRVALEPFFGA